MKITFAKIKHFQFENISNNTIKLHITLFINANKYMYV